MMPRRLFVFDPPDRFVAGTTGQPGSRTFFLQARRAGQVVSVVLEKVQVAVLAERLGVLLDELESRGISPATDGATTDAAPLDEPLNEAFRATTLTLGWDGDAERVLVEAKAEDADLVEAALTADDDDEEEDEDEEETVIDLSAIEGLAGTPSAELLAAFEGIDDDEDEGPDTLRVRLTAAEARGFVNRALTVVAAGRLPCPLCGQPLDPQGHICPRRNGHYVN
jgi:uncharacterized repeat protein (TIGR03847 family)